MAKIIVHIYFILLFPGGLQGGVQTLVTVNSKHSSKNRSVGICFEAGFTP